MNEKLLLLLMLCGFAHSGLFDFLIVYPTEQDINEHEGVVVDCLTYGDGEVQWERPNGLPLPPNAKQRKMRLYIKNANVNNSGYYICYSADRKETAKALIRVHPTRRRVTNLWPTTNSSLGFLFLANSTKPSLGRTLASSENLRNTNLQAVTSSRLDTQTQITENPFRVSLWSPTTNPLTTPYPCAYGVCNGICCTSPSNSFFDCANGHKINISLVCNRVNDCEDGSDESKCAPWPPKITVLPKSKLEVYCGDENPAKSGTLVFECESVGHPTPVIRWKKYDGHVPAKCQQYTKGGHGILMCPDFQQADQGSYSCVAENSVELAESQPKSIAKCSNTINCLGFRVVTEDKIEHCLDCYCSGRTSVCQNLKSNPTKYTVPFPDTHTEIFAKENGEILFIPTETELTPNSIIRQSALEVTYCKLSETELEETSLLKSFGRNIIIPRYQGKTNFLEKGPNVIIRGKDLSLMYVANLLRPKSNIKNMPVRLWPGNWHHLNKKVASRLDIMKVLSNVDSIFIRCEYEQGVPIQSSKDKNIIIESSTITNYPTSVSYVEKCNCPVGYDGLSCETCAAGYTKVPQGSGFICKPRTCNKGYIGLNCDECDTEKGYIKKGKECLMPTCNAKGSISVFPNAIGKCDCKEGVTGDRCDQCKEGSFYLHNEGCLKCWCSGVSTKCKTSKLVPSVISNTPWGGYNLSDGSNFWLLPSEFSGNRLTSYGGHLNYTMKFKPGIPKPTGNLSVEFLSRGDVTLVYTHTVDHSFGIGDTKSWTVPLTEKNWTKLDKSTITRGEFLSVLSRIKAIYIESLYHLSSGQATLTSTRMSTGISDDLDDTLEELPVEECICPPGYSGLSCESCSEGYYKKRKGNIIECLKCNCPNCDPELGCLGCPELQYRDNPLEEKMAVCKPCPCNGNGISCEKDDLNQIFCKCKPGFRGMHCEDEIPKEGNDLLMYISPRSVSKMKHGSIIRYNCTLVTNEVMQFSAEKRYQTPNSSKNSRIFSSSGNKLFQIFDVTLENGLEAVECFAYDGRGKIAGHVVSHIDLVTHPRPVRITDCLSDRIDVKESESRDIICNATGFPPPVITWYKKVKDQPTVKVDTSDGVHSINNASLIENGTIYTCIAENSENDRASCTKVLVVKKKCEVINIKPKQIITTEGEDFSLQCKSTTKSAVTWKVLDKTFNREADIQSPRAKIIEDTLVFKNSSVLDTGTYMCTAIGENGKINKTVSVTVNEKRAPPTVRILEYDMIIKEGETVKVNCEVTGKPTPVVTWSKLGGSFEWNVKGYGKTLTITKATVKNTGIYGCEASSIAGKDSSYISIEVEMVKFPPMINISEEVINSYVGEDATLWCLAIGRPRPSLNWVTPFKFNNIVKEEDNMVLIEPNESVKETATFKVTKDMDDQKVTCIASNDAGTVQKTAVIKVLQAKGSSNETVEFVPIGSFFEILCELPGTLKWEKNGGFVGDECPIFSGWMIPSVQIQHNGTYICKNEDSEKIIHLIVVGFVPRFSKASRSYLVLPVKLASPTEIRVEITFNSTHNSGVLLQEENHNLNIYLLERKVHVGIKSREEEYRMDKEIKLGVWYTLVVSISKTYVDITMYHESSVVYERKTEESKHLTEYMGFGMENFFVGGPMPMRKIWKKHHTHFEGCISRLIIDKNEFDIVKAGSHSNNVTLCNRCSGNDDPCAGKGKCFDAPTQYGFTCVCPTNQHFCPQSCAGKLCETKLDLCSVLKPCGGISHKCTNEMYSLKCECAFGYSGTTCEKVQRYSFCSNGNGFVRLPSSLLDRRLGIPETIRMAFTLDNSTGQLLWQGNQANHLSIAVENRILHYVYLNQHSKLEVKTGTELKLGEKYSIVMSRINNSVTLKVSRPTSGKDVVELYRNSTRKIHTNRVQGDIHLGNVPKAVHSVDHHVGLTGCIHYVSFGEGPKVNLPDVEIEKFNLRPSYDRSYSTSSEESGEGNSENYYA